MQIKGLIIQITKQKKNIYSFLIISVKSPDILLNCTLLITAKSITKSNHFFYPCYVISYNRTAVCNATSALRKYLS